MATIDTLIRGARVIDGTGNPWFYGDVALQGERVAEVVPAGQISPGRVGTVVEAAGMVVCPGFIDILSHSIVPLMIDGHCLSKISQGVTTEIMGEDWTPAPFGGKIDEPMPHPWASLIPDWTARVSRWGHFRDWLEAMLDHGVSSNIGSFLGGGSLRQYARGLEMGPPSPEEITLMQQVMREAMAEGAFGVSYALIYPPSAYTKTAELIEICRVVSEYGGIYITHIRSEADSLFEGINEALEIGRQAHLPVEIYHLKASGQRNWHKMVEVIALLNQARAEGLDVTADMYPYPAAGTGLDSVLPPWAAAGGKFFKNLRDPEMRAKIRAETLKPSGGWESMADLSGPEGVMPVGFLKPENKLYAGKRLPEIAEMRGQAWVDAVIDLLLSEEQRIGTIYYTMTEENLRLQLQQPWLTIGTDAGGLDPAWAKPLGPYHPRAYGSYARILGKYVRDEKVLTLEEAIRKMSSAVAARLGLHNRGLLHPGCYADVVIFDPQTIVDRATFEDPHQLSVGVRDVWINGVRVWDNGAHTGAKPGQIVEGPGRRYSI